MELVKRRRGPKRQRGISVTTELYERIGQEADKYGITWNDVVEQILERVLLTPANSTKTGGHATNSRGSDDVLVVTE
jgi:hypothetical protein